MKPEVKYAVKLRVIKLCTGVRGDFKFAQELLATNRVVVDIIGY